MYMASKEIRNTGRPYPSGNGIDRTVFKINLTALNGHKGPENIFSGPL